MTKGATLIGFAGLLAGCAGVPASRSLTWDPSSVALREVYGKIETPYSDSFERHAFVDGYISAYALGPASVGALIRVPEVYKEQKLIDAYRRGFSEGGALAIQTK